MKKKILFVTYGGSHVRIAQYLREELALREGVEPRILALSVAWKVLHAAGVPYGTLSSYLPLYEEEERGRILETGRRLAETAFNPQSDFPYDELVVYLGMSYRDLEAAEGPERAAELYRETGRKAFCPTGTMERILRHERPDAVVVTCVARMEKAAGIAANRLGIPVFYVPDQPEPEPFFRYYHANVCVMNEYARNYLLHTIAVPPEALDSLTVTGLPFYEDNLRLDPDELERCRKELGLSAYRHMLLYLEQPEQAEVPVMEAYLLSYAAEHPETLFVVKQHPNQTDPFPDAIPENVRFFRHYPLKYLLHCCDAALTKHSTAGIEAALAGKPLICTVFAPYTPWLSHFGIAVDIAAPEELPETFEACLNPDSGISKKLAEGRAHFQNHPDAAANTADVILGSV